MKYTMRYTANTNAMNVQDIFRWLWLLPLLFVIVGAILVFFGARQLLRADASQSWPSVTGVVTISELGKHLGNDRDDSTTYSADISYDYIVNDRDYVNGTVAFGSVQTSDPSLARLVLKRYPVGQPVTVYYNPANPRDAVLEPGLHGATWFLPIFGALFLVVGVGLFFFLRRMPAHLADAT